MGTRYNHKRNNHKSNGLKAKLWRRNIRELKEDLKNDYGISFTKTDPLENSKMWTRD